METTITKKPVVQDIDYPVNKEIEKCPRCGNNTKFRTSEVLEPGGEIFAYCICGLLPSAAPVERMQSTGQPTPPNDIIVTTWNAPLRKWFYLLKERINENTH